MECCRREKIKMTILELHNLTKRMIEEGISPDREIVYREKDRKYGKIDYTVRSTGEVEGKIIQILAEEWF